MQNIISVFGLAADGFEISMYFYVKVHFQKNFISENKVHCVFNRARTLTTMSSVEFAVMNQYYDNNNSMWLDGRQHRVANDSGNSRHTFVFETRCEKMR